MDQFIEDNDLKITAVGAFAVTEDGAVVLANSGERAVDRLGGASALLIDTQRQSKWE